MKRSRDMFEDNQAQQQQLATDPFDAYIANISTTEAVFHSILREMCMDTIHRPSSASSSTGSMRGKNEPLQCHGVFLHQLYATVTNKTLVDEEVVELRNRGILKLLHSSSHPVPTTDAVQTTLLMANSTFLTDIASLAAEHHPDIINICGGSSSTNTGSSSSSTSNIFGCGSGSCSSSSSSESISRSLAKFSYVARANSNSVQIISSELKRRITAEDGAVIEMSDNDIFNAMKAGFLLRKCNLDSDNTIYSFSHPGVRALSDQLDKTRSNIVGYIKKSRGKEVSERLLSKQAMSSRYSTRYHILDAIGLGLIAKVPSTRDVFYRVLSDNPS